MSVVPRGVTSWTREACRRSVRDSGREGHPVLRVWGFAPWPDHWNRRCVDLMIGALPHGQWIADYLVRYRRALDTRLVIWNRRIWRAYAKPGVPARTWQRYTGVSPHRDHVHVEFER